MVSYEYLKENLPGFQEHLVVLHQEGEHGVLVPVLVQYRHLLKNKYRFKNETHCSKVFDRKKVQSSFKRPEQGSTYI